MKLHESESTKNEKHTGNLSIWDSSTYLLCVEPVSGLQMTWPYKARASGGGLTVATFVCGNKRFRSLAHWIVIFDLNKERCGFVLWRGWIWLTWRKPNYITYHQPLQPTAGLWVFPHTEKWAIISYTSLPQLERMATTYMFVQWSHAKWHRNLDILLTGCRRWHP